MTKNIYTQRILIIDFGSQYSQLIARRIRELGVFCEILSCTVDEQRIIDFAPDGIILSGGPESVIAHDTPRAPEAVFKIGCPIFGICYGMQTMAVQLGGKVTNSKQCEFGYAQLQIEKETALLNDIVDHVSEDGVTSLDVWMSHGDQVTIIPPGFSTIANTLNTPIAAIADESRHWYGVQFHPEVTHTRQGTRILERFVRDICGCTSLWTPENIMEESIHDIKEKVGHDNVILGLSGGVDSLVAAVLLQKAIGNQLTCIYIDNGLMRLNESEILLNVQAKRLNLLIKHIDAGEIFLQALQGIADPEEKRKIIGKIFIDIFTEEAQKLPKVKWLAQGTIYSDVIESACVGKQAHTIKSHHNVGGLPQTLSLRLLEPLRELFKDEVRKLGLALGLPYDELYRHPFPGPGLGVRILGEITKDQITVLQHADAIFIEELKKHDLYQKVAQAFCVYLPVKSVGVVGDARRYADVIALRAVETVDFMTARWAHLPYEFLELVSQRIVNEVPNISRVVYDITGKPPATIEWE